MTYADLHHPCMFQILWSMLTCITHVCSRSYEVCWHASPWSVLDLMKYADLHHPYMFQILWSMLTCITQVCSGSYEVCWLASPMYVLDLMKYDDFHQPCVFYILSNMLTCIIHVCSCSYEYDDMHHLLGDTWNLSPELPWHMSLVFYMIEHTLVIQVSILKINSTYASQHTRMKYFNCTHGWCMSTYFLLNIQVGLRTQTRTYAHIVAT